MTVPTQYRHAVVLILPIWIAAAVPIAAPAGELFPYNPPVQQQSPNQPGATLTQETRNKINQLAEAANKLPPTERDQVKVELKKSLQEALNKNDSARAAYYGELLGRIQ